MQFVSAYSVASMRVLPRRGEDALIVHDDFVEAGRGVSPGVVVKVSVHQGASVPRRSSTCTAVWFEQAPFA
jgi:hypothetical protein